MNNLSFANLYTTSRHFDFFDAGEARARPVLPTPSAATLDEYWPEWRAESEGDDDDEKLDDAREIFNTTDRYYEWEDSFHPMMNFLWPVDLPYDADDAAIAAKLEEAGIAVTLMDVDADESNPWDDDSYGFALTGGGMNLAWHIAAAYVLAGVAPPFQLMEDLPRPCDVSDDLRDAIHAAATEAADSMKHRADRMVESVDRAARYKHG